MVTSSKSSGRDGMVAIPAGHYQVGSDRFYPEEAPVRQVSIASFEIDQAPVTTAEFQQFVDAASYQYATSAMHKPISKISSLAQLLAHRLSRHRAARILAR